jgi:hypothetical protein
MAGGLSTLHFLFFGSSIQWVSTELGTRQVMQDTSLMEDPAQEAPTRNGGGDVKEQDLRITASQRTA